VPIKDIEDACALLAGGAEDATFEQRRWIVRTLVHRIYADKTHWIPEGRLPCLHAAGTLAPQQRDHQDTDRPAEATALIGSGPS
jgi:hypothetical protein